MLAIPVLLALSAGLTLLAPLILTRGSWQVRHPRLALGLWHSAFLLSVTAVIASVVVAALAAVTAGQATDAATAIALTGAGWLALAALGAALALLGTGAGAVSEAQARNATAVHALAHTIHVLPGGVRVRRCTSDQLFALALPGRDREIAVSSALAEALTETQLRAVIAHEAAHLRERHHLALRLADLNVACLPRTRASRSFRRATGLLIELIADDAAARQIGPAHLANALVTMGALTDDAALDLRAERLAERRWRRAARPAPLASADLAPLGVGW